MLALTFIVILFLLPLTLLSATVKDIYSPTELDSMGVYLEHID
jgi:hypothetical protein